ncbi:hypothetical protein PsorP6_000228 [Peronosclerospora sorghi]|uniref:Uncharacterized protein n=1 Tax=Peronosclerospora sorghi TaxID=230839 RepID=A0ACC0WTH9_9STRA|nr:hypothetical protein PsorP6_000228 [Peronosclerospora sorghi]
MVRVRSDNIPSRVRLVNKLMEGKTGFGYGFCCMRTGKQRFLELPTAARFPIRIDYEVLRSGACFHTKHHFGMTLQAPFRPCNAPGAPAERFIDITKLQVLLKMACADTECEFMQYQQMALFLAVHQARSSATLPSYWSSY